MCVAVLFTASAFGQKTRVEGSITDAVTGEELPFVNVSFQGTKIGTTSKIDGTYLLESYYSSDSVEFSFVGYKTKAVKIKRDQAQTVSVKLESSDVELGEVVVKFDKKKENPAHPIIRNVIANKKINDREKLSAYQYEAYNKVEFDINNLDTEELKDRKLMKPFSFIFDYVDSTGEKPYLPIFITEAITDFYYRKNPKSQFEYIKATKVSGIENQSVSQFLGDMYQNVNIYDNNIVAFNRSFISPISSSGFMFYKYYLTDSSYIDNQYCYKIQFQAKRKQEPTFEGALWIHDTTYAVKEVEATISEDANLNFINKFWVKQEFDQVEPEVWMLTKDNLVVDFNIAKKAAGFYGRKTSTYKDFVINEEKENSFYSNVDNIALADDVNDKTKDYWDAARHETLTAQEKKIYHMIDSIKTVPQFTTILDIINIAVNGYYIAGPIEIGPYSKIYSFNPVEGNRFRIGGRTSNKFSTNLMLEGYLAYGLRDEELKYGGGVTYFFSKKPRVHMYAGYMNDVEQLGLSANNFSQDNLLSSVFRRNPANKLMFTERYKSYFDYEWFPGFNTRLSLKHETLRPLGVLTYERLTPENQITTVPQITNAAVSFYTRFAYKEKFVYGEFERISLGTKYPIIEAQYSKAFPGLSGSEYTFQKVELAVKHHFKLGIWGRTQWRLEGGMIEGNAPYPLLEIHNGNETFWYDDYSFNTMNFFEFVSDRYASLSATHHFEGFFLNRIPLLRRLKWREVVSAKALVGSYNMENSQLLTLTDNIYTLNKGPFYEAAIGIENIFKFIRLDALWRLSYLDNPNIVKFGIRMKFQFQF